jgi:PTH1 family peptidyl-tRNA hydrolase
MKYLIAGLGNIGPEYLNTRHNIGFMLADELAAEAKVSFSPGRYGDMAKMKHRGRTLLILKPSTFMNLSGNAIRYWLNKEKIPIENLLVIVDDIALPLGPIRLKARGGDGGHNGLISIIQQLGTQNFARLRFGIGDNFPKGYQVDYVLGEWTVEEKTIILPKLRTAVDAIKSFSVTGITRTMNHFNTKENGPPPSSS